MELSAKINENLQIKMTINFIIIIIVRYYYIEIIKVSGFLPKISFKNQPNINFTTAWQHWLGIASQAQKCLHINSKPLHQLQAVMKI